MNARNLLVASATLLLGTACSDANAPASLAVDPSLDVQTTGRPEACDGLPRKTESLVVSPSDAVIEVGESLQLQVTNQDGLSIPMCAISWSVAPDIGVASVATSGELTGVAIGGPVTVTASAEGKGKRSLSASATVVVRQAAVASVTLIPASSDLIINATNQLTAVLKDVRGAVLTGRDISWTSHTPEVASVDASGRVTGVFLGMGVTISATSEGVTGTSVVNVIPVALSSLSIVAAWWENGASRIYSMRGDGANPVYREIGISPSRVGNLMVARGGYFGENVIYAMDSTGAGKHLILGAGPSYVPHLSPDGSRITLMYGDCAGGHPLAVAGTDGNGVHAVDATLCTPIPPHWSPAGDQILFYSQGAINSVKPDLTGLRPILSVPNVATADWAANGTQIFFSAKLSTSSTYGIYRVDVDGTNLTPILVDTGTDEFLQDVSPLGDWLIVYRGGEIWAVSAIGGNATPLVANGQPFEGAQWVR